MNGFRLVIGSWKIIAIRLPRISRIFWSETSIRSSPSNTMRPPTMRPGGSWMSRMIERFVTDFPDPDSPTMPSVSPRRTSKLTPLTALTTPSSPKKCVSRPCTESRTPSGGFVVCADILGCLTTGAPATEPRAPRPAEARAQRGSDSGTYYVQPSLRSRFRCRLLPSPDQLGPDGFGIAARVVERARGVDRVVGVAELLRLGHLGRNARERVLAREPVAQHQPFELSLRRAVHDDERVEPLVAARLDHERRVDDDDRPRVARKD